MQTKLKTQAQTQTRKTFEWGVSSTTIDFMRATELARVRDGSANDCGCSEISPLPPQPQQRRPSNDQK